VTTTEARFSPEAEEAVIGLALSDRRVLPRVVAELSPGDFYRPVCAAAFAAIVDLHQNGYQVDATTVADSMRKSEMLDRVGGVRGLLDLTTGFPGPHVLGTYIAIIRREAAARTLASSLNEARNALTEQVDPGEVAELLAERLKNLDRVGRLPDGFYATWSEYTAAEPEWEIRPLIDGMCNQHTRTIVLASEKSGKALALDTPIPTPDGWRTMGDLRTGDVVFGPDGEARKIQATTGVMLGHDCYRVRFSDGAEIVADAQHLWKTMNYANRQPGHHGSGIHTTQELAQTVEARGGHTKNHQIPTCEPLHFSLRPDLPVGPYTLGAWLGDGTSRTGAISCADPQIITEIEKDGFLVKKLEGPFAWSITIARENRSERPDRSPSKLLNTLSGRLRILGLLRNKHIPRIYLEASVADRLALLQGLMDTDGTISDERRMSHCELSVTSEHLARDVHELVTGLGIKASFRESAAKLYGREVSRRYRIAFQTNLPVFRLERKRVKQSTLRTTISTRRAVVAVEPVPSVPVKCITVDHEDGMYLAGEQCIPTHNSVMLRQIAFCAAAGIHPFTLHPITPVRVLVLDAENDDDELRPSADLFRSLLAETPGAQPSEPALLTRPFGMDLRARRDRSELEEALESFRPQLIVGGPVYKLMPRREREDIDSHAAAMHQILDSFRRRWGCALILEHHAPTGKSGAEREIRSKGGQQWEAWPEVTVALHSRTTITGSQWLDVRFRHPPRGNYRWPKKFDRGTRPGEWPWIAQMRKGEEAPPPPEASLFEEEPF